MKPRSCLITFFLLLTSIGNVHAQSGVCNRAANDSAMLINRDANRRISNINLSNDPRDVKNAHSTIINWNRNNSLGSIRLSHAQCTRGYKAPQSIVDTTLTIYTMGLNRMMPRGMAHVDVSEILNGKPLGGPGAVIPNIRERVLRGDRGTGANIARDPIKCLTFQRKC